MEAREILEDVILAKQENAYSQSARRYLNDRIMAAYLVAKMYDDLVEYPEAARSIFGSKTCIKIIEFCRQN